MKTPEKTIKSILKLYQVTLGEDFNAYHHHAQRVYYYARTLLLMNENRKLAIAAAFHDLDIWVSDDMDYLRGSSDLALAFLESQKLDFLPDEMKFIIQNHHKLTKIKGNQEAEAFRKADLIDLTAGWIHYNLPQSLISEAERKFPRRNFTGKILKKIMKYSLKHPGKPFPMIKW